MAEPAAAGTPRADWPDGAWLRTVLGYEPRDIALFRRALTHRSAAGQNNERLEFLGDSVLNLLAAEQVFAMFPDADEGQLSRLRSRVVSAGPLAQVGSLLGIGDQLQLGSGELKTGGFRRESILADATEALIGAVYLDAGLEAARALVLRVFAATLAALDVATEIRDAKTRLQELLQSRAVALPTYELERVAGEPHAQTFWVRCVVEFPGKTRIMLQGEDFGGRQLLGEGVGSTRRRAEQAAAEAVLAQLPQVKGS
jgi:ribonuclease-3